MRRTIAGLGTGPDGTVRIDPEWLAELAGTWGVGGDRGQSVSAGQQPVGSLGDAGDTSGSASSARPRLSLDRVPPDRRSARAVA
ncbi:hypothetical protein GCM10010254_72500 [Streptomyces chromofuscus]|nr:hypothetical protein GCM10010254_72500 [Streptomyces chromofuscus]